jgi:hypothetical protein
MPNFTPLSPREGGVEDGVEASLFVELKPVGNGVTMDPQMPTRSGPAFGLSSLHKKQHVVAALDLGIFLLANQAFELFDGLGNLGEVVHGRRRFWEKAYQFFQTGNTAW